MNKQKLICDLKRTGIDLLKLEFCSAGYLVDVKLDPNNCSGWEELEQKPFNGFELIRMRQISTYARQLVLVPVNRKEFNDYSNRYVKEYGMSKNIALEDLNSIIQEYCSIDAKLNLKKYKESLKRRKNEH